MWYHMVPLGGNGLRERSSINRQNEDFSIGIGLYL